MKKLLMEAPGTYHHSLMVGNLAEVATEAINGNALLARVGAYYHDVGKLKRPNFL
jgi:putative nucleotidyltransferase with HDIG domain